MALLLDAWGRFKQFRIHTDSPWPMFLGEYVASNVNGTVIPNLKETELERSNLGTSDGSPTAFEMIAS